MGSRFLFYLRIGFIRIFLTSITQAHCQLICNTLLSGCIQMPVNISSCLNVTVSHPLLYIFQPAAVIQQRACTDVPEGVDIQVFRQAVLFENQLEAVSERGWRHGQRRTLPPEQEVIAGQFPSVIVPYKRADLDIDPLPDEMRIRRSSDSGANQSGCQGRCGLPGIPAALCGS